MWIPSLRQNLERLTMRSCLRRLESQIRSHSRRKSCLSFRRLLCVWGSYSPEAPTASRRPTVGAAASVFDQEDLALTIQKWLRTWAPADRYDSTAFDEAIARALVHALPRDDGGLTGTSTRQMVRSNVRFVPIAL